jgi:hypothetical protein
MRALFEDGCAWGVLAAAIICFEELAHSGGHFYQKEQIPSLPHH